MKYRPTAWVLLAALIWGSFGSALVSLLPQRAKQPASGMPCCVGRACAMHKMPVAMTESCEIAVHRSSGRASCTCSISPNDAPRLPSVLIERRFDLTRASLALVLAWSPFHPDACAAAALPGYAQAPDQPPERASSI